MNGDAGPASSPPPKLSAVTSPHAAASSQQQPAAMPSAARSARDITPSSSRASIRVLDNGDRPTRPASNNSLKQKMAKKAEEAPKPSKADEHLKALRADFDGLRSHLTCKICDRLLYQPYIISCGHTYCYSCLCTWFVNNKARKTCPDCRAPVTQPPAPAYVIREMATVFLSRAELLPPGETLEQHLTWQKEEADTVQQDKDNKDPRLGGLFKGCFRASTRPNNGPLRPFRDVEDGVDRCPMCSWELEDGECTQCGLIFDDNGEYTWGESFTGFSDMDEMSERDLSGEDLDAEMDMDDGDLGYDAYGEAMEGWQDYLEDDSPYMIRRFLGNGGLPPQFRRRPLSHSEAGSIRSYSQSIISDMYPDEMDTVEEEDEDGLDGDSSMGGFIDNNTEVPTSPSAASSTPGPGPQPAASQGRRQGPRARRVVESEASSSISSVTEEDDEEDEGPIRRGQRNRAQTRLLYRANGSREPTGPPSSASTDASHEQELDEDTQALLRADGWMLQHDGPDDEMEEDDDDDSDGGRTTVGWDATANSNDRVRLGGSLTPTADRPRPNAPIRPPSRAGPRFMDASRGLRRRSSVLSTSTVNYDDLEADDDDSDQDGDVNMAMNSLHARRSRAQLRNSGIFNNSNQRFSNRGPSHVHASDVDTDEEASRYNPRISLMFADHQRTLQEFQYGGPLIDQDPRSHTPIGRPRTANRNRPSPAQPFSPFIPPAPSRLRTPLMDNSSNHAAFVRGPNSPTSRIPASQPSASITDSIANNRAPSVTSASTSSAILTPGSSTSSLQSTANTAPQAQNAATVDMIDRPSSRVSARPPSTTGRRNSGFSPVYPGFSHPTVGLNQVRMQQRLGNPWGNFLQPPVRQRNSRPALRDQSSTATLRPASSRVNLRDVGGQQPSVRTQASRIDLRPQPSRRRLNNQASTRTLRASEHARPPQSPTASIGSPTQPASRPVRITQDERDVSTLARELINSRMRELGGTYRPGPSPARTNPFAPGFRRPSISSDLPPTVSAAAASAQLRSVANEPIDLMDSSSTLAPSPPRLGRRSSNRNIAAALSPTMPPAPAVFAAPSVPFQTGYFRSRQGSLTGGNAAYGSPLSANSRSPMVTAGNSGPLI
ncbi:hypothetical protein P154DRAFT_555443 [Amniculicola lignicola CBS 123094]|uniref:RING-type domain-containing protein n=1 Tax=Amniculicola lignicola CBS 123094 TaxID=1392246 RepID=A0A6A5WAP6_9PLEO|nr:hypothetical protein P154DRAFT_555443 [Amniculicola lignicola CBS 123094]